MKKIFVAMFVLCCVPLLAQQGASAPHGLAAP